MWTFLNAAFAFVTATVGLLGVGAVLDVSVPVTRKRRVAQWAKARVEQLRVHDLGGARLFTRIFGEKYLSRRALLVSIGISTISISVFYLIAHSTSDVAVQRMLYPIRAPLDKTGWITLCVYIPIILACDFFSYAQTRLFLSYIDQVKNFTVSAILYIADMMFSIVLFICGYSLARAIVTVIVATSHYAAPFQLDSAISPDVVAASYHVLKGNKVLHDPLTLSVEGVDTALKAYRATPSAATERALISETLRLQYGDLARLGGTVTSARLACLRDMSFAAENQNRLFEILKDSDNLVMRQIGLPMLSISFGGRAPFYENLPLTSATGGACPIYAVYAKVRMDPRFSISKVTWFEYFLGSLAATTNELNYAIYTKMSAFPSDDPVGQAPMVLTFALAASNSQPLGIGATRDAASTSYYLNDVDTGSVQLPLGPLVASSLAANLFFGFYVLAACSMAVGGRLFEKGWATQLLKSDAVFVRIAFGFVIVILVVAVVLFALDGVFNALVHVAVTRPIAP